MKNTGSRGNEILKKPQPQSYNAVLSNKERFEEKKPIFGFKLDLFINDMLKWRFIRFNKRWNFKDKPVETLEG